jgi:hypothetical protein
VQAAGPILGPHGRRQTGASKQILRRPCTMLGRHRGALLFFFFSSSSLLLLLPLLIIIVRHCTLSYRIFGRVLLVFCIIVSSRLVLSAGRSGQDRTGQGLRAGHANPPRGVGREGKGREVCVYVCTSVLYMQGQYNMYTCTAATHGGTYSTHKGLPSPPPPRLPGQQSKKQHPCIIRGQRMRERQCGVCCAPPVQPRRDPGS